MEELFEKFNRPKSEFRPTTSKELFLLRLAQKLDDTRAIGHYLTLSQSYSDGQLLLAYRRAMGTQETEGLGKRFVSELRNIYGNGYHDRQPNLISIRVERRSIAIAVFHGEALEYTDARQLSSNHDKALRSAVGFVNWILDRFPVESAALEALAEAPEVQRAVLHNAICQTLRDRMLPLWEVSRTDLLKACGWPAPKSRAQLREVATGIWPVLAGTHSKAFVQDAAMLGLHVQIERLFIINQQNL